MTTPIPAVPFSVPVFDFRELLFYLGDDCLAALRVQWRFGNYDAGFQLVYAMLPP